MTREEVRAAAEAAGASNVGVRLIGSEWHISWGTGQPRRAVRLPAMTITAEMIGEAIRAHS